MIKKYFIILVGLICVFNANAKKIEGQILRQKDTIQVTFNIPVRFLSGEPNYERLQTRVKYFDASGKKVILKPDDALEFRFKVGAEEVRMISRYNSLDLGNIFSTSINIFLKLEIDGKLKLFSYYYTQSSGGTYNASTGMMSPGFSYSVERYILQKGSGELKRPKGLTFKKDMVEYFKDCPELVKKIESRDLRKGELEEIVRFYNSNCK